MASRVVSNFTDIIMLVQNEIPKSKCEIWTEYEDGLFYFVFAVSLLGRRVCKKYMTYDMIDMDDQFERKVVIDLLEAWVA